MDVPSFHLWPGRDVDPVIVRDAAVAGDPGLPTVLDPLAASGVAGWLQWPRQLHPDRGCGFGGDFVQNALQTHRPEIVHHRPVVGILLVCRVRPRRHFVSVAAAGFHVALAEWMLMTLRSLNVAADLPRAIRRLDGRVGADVRNDRLVIGLHRPVGPVLAVGSDLLIASSFSAKNAKVGGKYTEPQGRGLVACLPFKRMVADRRNAHLY